MGGEAVAAAAAAAWSRIGQVLHLDRLLVQQVDVERNRRDLASLLGVPHFGRNFQGIRLDYLQFFFTNVERLIREKAKEEDLKTSSNI